MSADPALVAWMVAADRSDGFRADLWTITTKGGEVFRWTSLDFEFAAPDGRVFVPGPGIKRSRVTLTAGIQVSTLDMVIEVDDSIVLGGMPALHFADRGMLDGASVALEWAYWDAARVFKGSMQRFSGTAGLAMLELGRISLQVRSDIARLNTPIPREVYQPACLNQLFDAHCGLDSEAWTVAGVVTSVAAGRAGLMGFTASGLTQAAGFFELGAVEFYTGELAHVIRTVKAHQAGGVLSFAMALPVAPQVGDEFRVVPGCNRSVSACRDKFNNIRFGRLAFRGTPFVPAPETVA